VRPVLAFVTAAVLATSLAGCSAGGSSACTPLANDGGSAVDSITIGGTAGQPPTATFPTPLVASKAEVKVLKSAQEGQQILPGGSFSAELSLFNGETGESLGSTSFNGSDIQTSTLSKTSQFSFLTSVLQCAHAGSRIVGIVPNKELVNASGQSLTGGSAAMTVVVVADITGASLARANGEQQSVPDGLPKVVLDPKGVPGITVPKTAAPTELKVVELKKGTGAAVTSSSNVVVHYTGVLWDSGTVFDSSWTNGQVATFNVAEVVPGFSQALIGHKVGSQILAVIPPELGYGATGAGTKIPANATLVFVIDILGLG
jgi:hypothetical protein